MFADANRVLKLMRWAIAGYAAYWVLSSNYAVYEAMAPFLYHAPGLLGKIQLQFPSSQTVFLVRLAVLLSAALFISNRTVHIGSWGVFFGLFYLDVLSNGFGFINVQIHFVWFSLFYALSFHVISKRTAVRAMELVVVLAYFQAGYAKLSASGLAWASDGTTLQIAWLRQGVPLGTWLAQYRSLAIAASWASVAFECAFIFYYLIPRIQMPLLSIGLIFHFCTWLSLGIDFSHLWVFSAAVLISRLEVKFLKEPYSWRKQSPSAPLSQPMPKLS